MIHRHQTAPTQFVEAGGVRFALSSNNEDDDDHA